MINKNNSIIGEAYKNKIDNLEQCQNNRGGGRINKELLTGTVPVNKKLLTGTVPVNKIYQKKLVSHFL